MCTPTPCDWLCVVSLAYDHFLIGHRVSCELNALNLVTVDLQLLCTRIRDVQPLSEPDEVLKLKLEVDLVAEVEQAVDVDVCKSVGVGHVGSERTVVQSLLWPFVFLSPSSGGGRVDVLVTCRDLR